MDAIDYLFATFIACGCIALLSISALCIKAILQ